MMTENSRLKTKTSDLELEKESLTKRLEELQSGFAEAEDAKLAIQTELDQLKDKSQASIAELRARVEAQAKVIMTILHVNVFAQHHSFCFVRQSILLDLRNELWILFLFVSLRIWCFESYRISQRRHTFCISYLICTPLYSHLTHLPTTIIQLSIII